MTAVLGITPWTLLGRHVLKVRRRHIGSSLQALSDGILPYAYKPLYDHNGYHAVLF